MLKIVFLIILCPIIRMLGMIVEKLKLPSLPRIYITAALTNTKHTYETNIFFHHLYRDINIYFF